MKTREVPFLFPALGRVLPLSLACRGSHTIRMYVRGHSDCALWVPLDRWSSSVLEQQEFFLGSSSVHRCQDTIASKAYSHSWPKPFSVLSADRSCPAWAHLSQFSIICTAAIVLELTVADQEPSHQKGILDLGLTTLLFWNDLM